MSVMSITKSKEDWTFKEIKTNQFTHGLHQYPARMHPEIAKRIIEKYAPKSNQFVFDPFMGSGGVLVESKIHGNNSIGIDINPFAVLLSKVKVTPLDSKKLQNTFDEIVSCSINDIKDKKSYQNGPTEINLEFWYKKHTINHLEILKHHIFQIKNKDIQDFFKICFSFTTRRTSYQENGIYKIYRIKPEKRDSFNPDVMDIFKKITNINIQKIREYSNEAKKVHAITILGDTRDVKNHFKQISTEIMPENKCDLVVTSPPYGDHGTTVAYGQFSKHPGTWIELENQQELKNVDKQGLGGRKKKEILDLKSPLLEKTLKIIEKRDKEVLKKTNLSDRAGDVYSFFFDLDECFKNISDILKPNKSHCCFVVANRKVRRHTIPTDEIIVELADKYGFRHKETIYRSIINKAMAKKNTPENISEYSDSTMNEESIVIWEF